MHLSKGFNLAKKYYPLALVAALLDLVNLGDISHRAQAGLHFKATIPSAMPTLTQILPDAPNVGGSFVNLDFPFSYLGAIGLIAFLGFIILNSYVKGGFLGCVLEGLKGGEVSKEVFFAYATKFWSRFLIQTIIVFAAVIFLGLLSMSIGPLALLFIIALLAAFLLLFFWDYILVREDLNVVDAAEESWRLVIANLGSVILFILPILLLTAIFSVIANMLAATPLVLLAILAYAVFATGIIFAVMSFYMELTPEEEPGLKDSSGLF